MKCQLAVALVLALGLIASSNALPAKRMAYYQQGAHLYAGPKRMMYVQYVQPAERSNARRSAGGAAALVAGDTVATRTYLDDCAPGAADTLTAGSASIDGSLALRGEAVDGGSLQIASVSQPALQAESQHDEDLLAAIGAHSSHAVAEAYPAPSVDEAPQQLDYEVHAKVAETPAAPADAIQPAFSESPVAAEPDTAAALPVALPEEAAAPAPAPLPEVAPTVEVTLTSNDEAKVAREYNFEAAISTATDVAAPPAAPVAAVPAPEPETPALSVDVKAALPAPAPIAPVKPAPAPVAAAAPARRYYAPKRKIHVELEQTAADAETDEETEHAVATLSDSDGDGDEDDEDTYLVPVAKPPPRRTAVKKAGSKGKTDCAGCKAAGAAKPKPLPAGTFFPIDFGGTSGGAIAIANAFSTGEGGSATSHAIAYGSPDAVRARIRPQSKHH